MSGKNLPRGRPFSKGISGNPGGRSKALRAVETAAKAHTDAAIGTLAEICTDQGAPPSARVTAAVALLDRAWGKPTQPIAGDENRPPMVPVLNVTIAAPDKETREQWLVGRDRDIIDPSPHIEGGKSGSVYNREK